MNETLFSISGVSPVGQEALIMSNIYENIKQIVNSFGGKISLTRLEMEGRNPRGKFLDFLAMIELRCNCEQREIFGNIITNPGLQELAKELEDFVIKEIKEHLNQD